MHSDALPLIDQRMRVWHTQFGRFTQRDPLGYPDGMNAYAGYHVMWGGLDPMETTDIHTRTKKTVNKWFNREYVDAGVTSWTKDRDIAKRFAGDDGIVLEADSDDYADRVVPRPNVGKHDHEKELLLKGEIKGNPTKP